MIASERMKHLCGAHLEASVALAVQLRTVFASIATVHADEVDQRGEACRHLGALLVACQAVFSYQLDVDFNPASFKVGCSFAMQCSKCSTACYGATLGLVACEQQQQCNECQIKTEH